MDHVPKRILLTWKEHKVPDCWQVTVDTIRDLMPEWTLVVTSDEDNLKYVDTYYPEFLEAFKSMELPIMRADVIRYLQLHRYGGIYHDLDICPVRSYDYVLDRLPDADVFLVQTPQGGITNSFMISKPGVHFWYQLVEECFRSISGDRPFWSDLTKSTYVLNTTGPCILTRFSKKDHKSKVVTLPLGLINPYTMHDATYHWKDIMDRDPYYYWSSAATRPLPGSSWVTGWENQLSLFYTSNRTRTWLYILVIIAVIMVLVLYRIKGYPCKR